MTPFAVAVPGSDGAYSGEFTITSLAVDDYVNVPTMGSVDFNAEPDLTPEPSSALLLIAGVSFVEFLRRKVRA
jgi:hypothetical protein